MTRSVSLSPLDEDYLQQLQPLPRRFSCPCRGLSGPFSPTGVSDNVCKNYGTVKNELGSSMY